MRHLKLLTVLLLALAVLPAPALASKPATPSQKRALMGALGDRGAPARCLTALISTANPSFAAVYFTGLWGAGQRMPRGCERYAANGITIFHHRAGRWRFVTAGSSFVTRAGGCRVPHVPQPVVEDFRLCGSLAPRTPPGPTMTAPARARLRSPITVHAARLAPGRYTLLLALDLPTHGASPTICSGRVGSARARAGALTISGKLPRRLACRTGNGASEGEIPVRAGKYVLSLGILLPPAGFRGGSFVKRTIRLAS